MASKQTKIILAVPLCFRAMAAWEQKIPVNITVEERHCVTLAQNRNKLKTETHVVPDPFSLKSGWIGESIPGMKKWPSLYYMDIAKYLKDNILSDCLLHRLNCEYKEGKAFRCFSCDFVKEIYFHDISDTCPYCFIRKRVTPSQRTSATPYTVWALLQKDKTDQPGGRVINAYCSCTAGPLGCCNHVVAMLFCVEAAVMQGLTKPTCTSQKSSWNVPKGIKTTLDVGPVSEDTFKCYHYRKKREQNIEQPQIEKKRIPKLQNLSSAIRIKCS